MTQTPDIESILNRRFRWPKRGDRLLKKSSDWNKSADFDADAFSRHVHIWSGYMRAGAALVEECERSPHDRHFLIYPILFNYRHGLELAIKWIIDTYGRYADVYLDPEDRDHDLWLLWLKCKKIVLEVGQDDVDGSIRRVEQVVKDFHDIDKSSMSFRYSSNKNGQAIDLPDIQIDLENIRDVMEGVDNFFGGADGQLDANSSAVDW